MGSASRWERAWIESSLGSERADARGVIATKSSVVEVNVSFMAEVC